MIKERSEAILNTNLTIRDDQNAVCGRARVESGADGKVWVYLQQTYAGSADGTLRDPTKCDLDVLQSIVEEAVALKDDTFKLAADIKAKK